MRAKNLGMKVPVAQPGGELLPDPLEDHFETVPGRLFLPQHLKIALGTSVSTSFGLIIRRDERQRDQALSDSGRPLAR
ncbi:MAG: hypothetical protein ACJ71Z_10985 [Aeromicrobium sp.]